MRVFPDGSYIILSSHAEFVKKLSTVVWSSKDLEIFKSYTESGKRYCFMGTYKQIPHYFLDTYKQIPPCLLPITREFNVDNGLIIRETHTLYEDKFNFSTQSKDFNIYGFCFNNLDFIEKFIFYFKDRASLIIKKATIEQRLYFQEPQHIQLNSC